MGFCSNDSLGDSVDLETCSGYHVAAFSVVSRAFPLGASLRQCAAAQKQAPPPKFSPRLEIRRELFVCRRRKNSYNVEEYTITY